MWRREVELQSARALDLRVAMELRPVVRGDRLAAPGVPPQQLDGRTAGLRGRSPRLPSGIPLGRGLKTDLLHSL